MQSKDHELHELRNNKSIFEHQINELERMVQHHSEAQVQKTSKYDEEK